MLRLPRTESSIAELAASRYQDVGMRPGYRMMVESQGFLVGEEPFEAAAHEMTDINLFSLNAAMTGMFHVTERIPEKALDIHVVRYDDPEAANDPSEIYWGRKVVTEKTHQALRRSLLFNDRAHFYVAGDVNRTQIDRDTTILEDTNTPEKAATAVAEVCALRGLAIVISTFKNLPLETTGPHAMTVGVKVNHVFDLQLPRNIGEWATGEKDIPVVQTNDRRLGKSSKELERYNFRQQARHQQLVQRLEAAGVHLAQAVFDRAFPEAFDSQGADCSIAHAIKRLSRNH